MLYREHRRIPVLFPQLLRGRSGCERRARVGVAGVRPGAAGLLIVIEYSSVRDNLWMYLTPLVTTRIGVELAAVQGNYLIVL